MNFATIFAGNANNENNYAIGFAVRVKKIGEKVGRLIPKGILIDAVHNRDNGYMYKVFIYFLLFRIEFCSNYKPSQKLKNNL